MLRSLTFLLILNSIIGNESAKILAVFPTPSVSHQVVFRPLTQELAKRGHEVTVITTDPAFRNGQELANLTEIDVHDISYRFLTESILNILVKNEIGKEFQWVSLVKDLEVLFTIMEVQVKSELVQNLINKKKKFDLLLIEAYVRPAMGYSYVFKAPVIQVSSFGAMLENLETVGAPTHPTLYPIPYRQRLYNLSIWDKIREYYFHIQLMIHQQHSDRVYDEMLKRIFGPNVPSINELIQNVHMLFLNVHPIWMNNQPMPPNVVFMGGLHQKPIKDLPQDLKSFLDSSKTGVVYVSFGTNVHPMMFPAERLKVITEALSELPYDILMKWNDDELPGQTSNIKISKWLPQSDLLRHPNIKAFVMQGGLQSTDEAISAGIPLICIPMMGDQWYNAEKYVHFKIGVKLDFLTLTKLDLTSAIENVIANKSYRENIVKLSELMNDQPESPLERAIWWTEYVIRHGGASHLRTPAANMSWAEYYELEFVLIALTSIIVSFIAIFFVFMFLFRYVFQLFKSNVKFKKS